MSYFTLLVRNIIRQTRTREDGKAVIHIPPPFGKAAVKSLNDLTSINTLTSRRLRWTMRCNVHTQPCM